MPSATMVLRVFGSQGLQNAERPGRGILSGPLSGFPGGKPAHIRL